MRSKNSKITDRKEQNPHDVKRVLARTTARMLNPSEFALVAGAECRYTNDPTADFKCYF